MPYRLAHDATGDRIAILEYGIETFGVQQAIKYDDRLDEVFDLIAANPRMGTRWRGDLRRRFVCQSHVIYYEIQGTDVLVLRILHGRMRQEDHLG